ncbi:MAG: hypothetical protein ABSE47_03390 [Acidimicrobiales bacterium]
MRPSCARKSADRPGGLHRGRPAGRYGTVVVVESVDDVDEDEELPRVVDGVLVVEPPTDVEVVVGPGDVVVDVLTRVVVEVDGDGGADVDVTTSLLGTYTGTYSGRTAM